MPDLSVEVRGHEIVVTKPSQGLQVTYRKLGRSPMLMADDLMRNNLDKDELKFLVRAWNAAFAKAKELYWIYLISGPARRLTHRARNSIRSLTREQGPWPLPKHQHRSVEGSTARRTLGLTGARGGG